LEVLLLDIFLYLIVPVSSSYESPIVEFSLILGKLSKLILPTLEEIALKTSLALNNTESSLLFVLFFSLSWFSIGIPYKTEFIL